MHRTIGFAFVAAVGAAVPATAQGYTFVNVADSGGPLTGFDSPPSINAGGTVAFRASFDDDTPQNSFDNVRGVFTGGGGGVVAVADTRGDFGDFGFAPSINAAGTVAFRGVHDTGGAQGIYTAAGQVTEVARVVGGGDFVGEPSINAAGRVAYVVGYAGGFDGFKIFAGGGGAATRIADTDGAFFEFGFFPTINDAGTVAFAAQRRGGGQGVYTGDGGAVTTLYDSAGDFQFFSAPTINAAGRAAFYAALDSGARGIFSGDGGTATPVADDAGPFGTFDNPAINAGGAVAFFAALDDGSSGIFTGGDPTADRVVGTGDALFGSTVTAVRFLRGLSDGGDIAFNYELADGRTGIAVAAVPEPAGVALLAAGALLSLRRSRVRGG
jgi:hypothetical protein